MAASQRKKGTVSYPAKESGSGINDNHNPDHTMLTLGGMMLSLLIAILRPVFGLMPPLLSFAIAFWSYQWVPSYGLA